MLLVDCSVYFLYALLSAFSRHFTSINSGMIFSVNTRIYAAPSRSSSSNDSNHKLKSMPFPFTYIFHLCGSNFCFASDHRWYIFENFTNLFAKKMFPFKLYDLYGNIRSFIAASSHIPYHLFTKYTSWTLYKYLK